MLDTTSRYPVKPKADATTLLGKQLPASLEAERAVLGALLLNDEYMGRVSNFLTAEDFYNPAHKIIYHTLLSLIQQLSVLI